MNLEKRNFTKKYIKKLHIATGKLITDPKEILLEEKRFYEDLYTERNHRDLEDVDNEFVKPKLLPRLSQMQRESCEGKLKEEECKAVLKTFKNNKSPGNDGLTVEFYRYFWNEIKGVLIPCYNRGYDKQILTVSQRQAVITLLDKDKDRLLLKNWRPISLLNTDYKIMTKAIANRIKNV